MLIRPPTGLMRVAQQGFGFPHAGAQAQPVSGDNSGGGWLLASGAWNDSGVWDDASMWKDAA